MLLQPLFLVLLDPLTELIVYLRIKYFYHFIAVSRMLDRYLGILTWRDLPAFLLLLFHLSETFPIFPLHQITRY
jgi:hypothetical protein